MLRSGGDAISEIPRDRWDVDALYDPHPGTPGKMSTRWGGFLKGVDLFDPHFFGISPREAAIMDPQQRLLLEIAWEALENAGQAPDRLAGSKTGVFVGIGTFDYSNVVVSYERHLQTLNAYAGTGNAHSLAANRISYLLDLRGPSMALDTACSSSLVAVHLACDSLRRGQSDLALAGGVNLILSPETTISFSHAHMMAADGCCKTFDARADGYVRGEGCGVAVLKRLSDALRDADHILALVGGSAINQDGRTAGIAAPNGLAQQETIRESLAQAGIEPYEVSYVETHGTGTSIGDPIEVEAIQRALGIAREAGPRCLLGSVKANIGHLENASGMAGLAKVIVCLQHGENSRTNSPAGIKSAHFASGDAFRKSARDRGLAGSAAAHRRVKQFRIWRHQRPRDAAGGPSHRPPAHALAAPRAPVHDLRENACRAEGVGAALCPPYCWASRAGTGRHLFHGQRGTLAVCSPARGGRPKQ